MSAFKVAAIQLEIALGEPEKNLTRAAALIEEARRAGAQLAVLPELWPTGYELERASLYAASINEGISAEIGSLAQKFEIFLCGSILEAAGDKFYNTMLVHGPNGKLLASYRKIHLFGLMNEPKYLAPGRELAALRLPCGKAGLAICYDLRFPEIFRRYALDGAQLTILCAEWPHPRLEHWRTLLRARAIENQSYVVAANAVGPGRSGNIFFGHSMVIDPWGEIIVEGGKSEGVLSAEIDTARVAEVRASFPFFTDRRNGLYSLP